MTDPDLGAGNFLDHALAHNPHRSVPFVFSHHLDHRGQVVLKGHSLEDLARLRDRYARWYWANGVRAGDPVGVVIAEGLPPIIHFLALSALGAIPALVNDAMRPDIMVRYLDHVGVVGIVADDTTRLSLAYRWVRPPGRASWRSPPRSRPATPTRPSPRRSTPTATPPTTSSR